MNAITKFRALQDELSGRIHAAQKALQVAAEENLGEIFAEFFATFPQVQTIHWTQYTPHFNDGDECIFSIGEVFFSAQSADEVDSYDEEGFGQLIWDSEQDRYVDDPRVTPELTEAMNALSCMVNDLEDPLKSIYGDHKWVLVTRAGVEVRDYDHD